MVIDILLYISTYSEKKKGLGTLRYSKSKKKKRRKNDGYFSKTTFETIETSYIYLLYISFSAQ